MKRMKRMNLVATMKKTKYPILETKMNEPILKSKFTCVQISNTEIHGPARFLTEP